MIRRLGAPFVRVVKERPGRTRRPSSHFTCDCSRDGNSSTGTFLTNTDRYVLLDMGMTSYTGLRILENPASLRIPTLVTFSAADSGAKTLFVL
jgi:hypothetical protein